MNGEYTGLIQPAYPDGGQRSRVRADKRTIDYTSGTLQPFVCDLSVAQPITEFQFTGDVLYVDKLAQGTIRARLDTSWQRGFPMGANSAFKGIPYKSVLLDWDAQGAGKTLVLWHGYGVEIVPPNQDITTIGSITNPVTVIPGTSPTGKGFIFADSETDNDHAYHYSIVQAAVAAQFSAVQLVGSLKTVYVDSVIVRSNTAGVVFGIVRYVGALANNISPGANKRLPGPGPGTVFRRETSATSYEAAGPDSQFYHIGLETAQLSRQVFFNPPIKLVAGDFLTVYSTGVNITVGADFQYREY